MTVILPPSKYTDANRQIAFNDQLRERVQTLPGVSGAGTVNILPVNAGNTTRFFVDGDPIPAPGQEIEANIRTVSDDYFTALGVPVLAGRAFDARDTENGQSVVIIGKTIADRVFAGRDPIGRKLRYSSIQADGDIVVGVVGDVKITGLDEAIRPVLYYPFRQSSSTFQNLVARTDSDPNMLAGAIRNEIRSLEPDAAILNVRTMDDM